MSGSAPRQAHEPGSPSPSAGLAIGDWPRASRRAHWISSVSGDKHLLAQLDERLALFYGERDLSSRSAYQEMLDSQGEESENPGAVLEALLAYLTSFDPGAFLEVGCGNGRLYRQLRRCGLSGSYCGVELSGEIIELNRSRNPEAEWLASKVYSLPFSNGVFDVCFAYYVLEHLVYPERGLLEMLRVLRPGGRLVLVFPDFSCFRIFPSQFLGLSAGRTALAKLRSGRVVDAFVSLYDSRIRLPRLLRQAHRKFGPFPINCRPICLSRPDLMMPDVDAVYVATKYEVDHWAQARGLVVEYPAGTQGDFHTNAFIVLRRGKDGGQLEARKASVEQLGVRR